MWCAPECYLVPVPAYWNVPPLTPRSPRGSALGHSRPADKQYVKLAAIKEARGGATARARKNMVSR